jgi:hypothetical protein
MRSTQLPPVLAYSHAPTSAASAQGFNLRHRLVCHGGNHWRHPECRVPAAVRSFDQVANDPIAVSRPTTAHKVLLGPAAADFRKRENR